MTTFVSSNHLFVVAVTIKNEMGKQPKGISFMYIHLDFCSHFTFWGLDR